VSRSSSINNSPRTRDENINRPSVRQKRHSRKKNPLNLVMELASCDLAAYLAEKGDDVSFSLKYWFCRDIGAGLDALHECGLIHSDLKPENILVFHEGGYKVAKIADFGPSIDEAASSKSTTRLLGTLGW
jgi:serine/threonine protein kinase